MAKHSPTLTSPHPNSSQAAQPINTYTSNIATQHSFTTCISTDSSPSTNSLPILTNTFTSLSTTTTFTTSTSSIPSVTTTTSSAFTLSTIIHSTSNISSEITTPNTKANTLSNTKTHKQTSLDDILICDSISVSSSAPRPRRYPTPDITPMDTQDSTPQEKMVSEFKSAYDIPKPVLFPEVIVSKPDSDTQTQTLFAAISTITTKQKTQA